MKTLPSRSAFTLIELLVSVVIIAILCMLGLTIYGTVIDRARCTKDMAQMRTIAAAVLMMVNSQQPEKLREREVALGTRFNKEAAESLPTDLAMRAAPAKGPAGNLQNRAYPANDRGEAEPGWRSWDVRLEQGVAPGDVLERCVAARFPLRRFEQVQASLHDVFVHIVGTPESAQ